MAFLFTAVQRFPPRQSCQRCARRAWSLARRIFARERRGPKRWTVRSARGWVAAVSQTRAERTSHPLSQSVQKSAAPQTRCAFDDGCRLEKLMDAWSGRRLLRNSGVCL